MNLRREASTWLTDGAPYFLKQGYVRAAIGVKKALTSLGILPKLDRWAASSRRGHHLRSLLAIHQLDDMIELDVPWWTYPAVDWVDEQLRAREQTQVLEFGSGASSVWLAKRGATVVSVEHDRAWYLSLKNYLEAHSSLPGVVRLTLCEPQVSDSPAMRSPKCPGRDFRDYVLAPTRLGQTFDLIIIDGRCRVDCLESCQSLLNPGGFILLDNSERHRYQKGINHSGLDCTRFRGRVPGSPFLGETAILRKR